jgi:hypothetical protein
MNLDVSFYVWLGLRVQALALLPLVPHHTTDPRGDVVTLTGMVGASVGYDVLGGTPVRLVPSLGAAWQYLHMTGRANAPYRSDVQTADVAHFFLGLDAAYAIVPQFSFVAGVRVGVVAPAPHMVIAGDDLGAFGRPAAQLFAGAAIPILSEDL